MNSAVVSQVRVISDTDYEALETKINDKLLVMGERGYVCVSIQYAATSAARDSKLTPEIRHHSALLIFAQMGGDCNG
jgi:hypothetical protein